MACASALDVDNPSAHIGYVNIVLKVRYGCLYHSLTWEQALTECRNEANVATGLPQQQTRIKERQWNIDDLL
jgi:hypothetical protein